MRHIHLLQACTSLLACFWGGTSPYAADPLRPLRVVEAEGAESQVDENSPLQEPRWVIRHRAGLREVGVKSGVEKDVVTHPQSDGFTFYHRVRLLTADASAFGHVTARSRETQEITIARVRDANPIVKLDSQKLVGKPNWPAESFLASDASSLWCLLNPRKGSRVVRIDFLPEPRVAASVELKGSRKDAFDLFVSPDEPALVVAATSSPQGGWFRVFDRDLQLQEERRLPPAAAYFAANRPEPLIFVNFPATSTWQLLSRQGKNFKVVSQAACGPPRPRWHLGEQLLMAAAISPDGKLLVTSQVSERPTISVWNPANGKLLREVQLEGGFAKLDLASHHTIFRLAFSLSGKYLTASDLGNAYLLEVADLVKDSTATKQ